MRIISIILFLITLIHATDQIPDKLIYNNRKYIIRPLKTIYKTDERYSTACYRGYVATWKIKNDSLFLKNINTKHCSKINKDKEIESFLGKDKLTSWYTGLIVIPYYKKIGSFNKINIYEHMAFNIVNGVCENKFPTCIYDDGNMYSNGMYFYKNGSYIKALANFAYIVRNYSDFFKNDWNYFLISSCLKYLGCDSLSNIYLDSIIIKYPKSRVIECVHAVRYISGKYKDDNSKNTAINKISDTCIQKVIYDLNELQKLELKERPNEYKDNLILFFPWIYVPVSKYYNSLESIFDGTIIDKPCLDQNYVLEFKDNSIYKLYNELINVKSN